MILSNMTDTLTQTLTVFGTRTSETKAKIWGHQEPRRSNGKAPRILDFGNRCVVILTGRFNYNPENIVCLIPDECDKASTEPDANRNTSTPDVQRTSIVQP